MDLYRYASNRLAMGGAEREVFVRLFTKRVIRSMSRVTATRIHLNKWLCMIKTTSLTGFPELINLIEEEAAKSIKRAPLGANRLRLMLKTMTIPSGARDTIVAQTFIDNESLFEDDQTFFKGVAARFGVSKQECGHWHSQSITVRGNEETYDIWSHPCPACANDLVGTGRYTEYNNMLIVASHAVTALSVSGERILIDRRNPAFVFSEQRQIYHHRDWSPYANLVADYHSSKRKGFKTIESPWQRSNRRAFGCELEIQVTSGPVNTAAGRVHDAVNPSGEVGEYCYFERDGSIGTGFEMVTQPAGLDVHREKFAKFLQDREMKRGMRSHEGGSCGFHVHVGRECLTQGQIYRIQSFLNDVRNEGLIKKIARRYQSGYSKFKPEMAKFSPHGKANGDRYEAVNVTGSETIEFRIFRGSLRYESIMAALEFVNAVLDFCTPGVTSIMDFNALGFKKFIMQDSNRTDTKYLRSYLSLDDRTDRENLQLAA